MIAVMVTKGAKRGSVTPENLEESRRLLAIWNRSAEARAADGAGTQLAFGLKYDIGNQAAVGHFLHGRSAISLKAARGFAQGLKCKVSDFSPRLAAQMASPDPVDPQLRASILSRVSKFLAQEQVDPRLEYLIERFAAATDAQRQLMYTFAEAVSIPGAEAVIAFLLQQSRRADAPTAAPASPHLS